MIGIGGSYLGARAAIEFLGHSFYNVLDKSVRKTPEIYFCGNSISSTYLKHLMDVVGDRDFFHQHDFQIRHHHRAGHCVPGI